MWLKSLWFLPIQWNCLMWSYVDNLGFLKSDFKFNSTSKINSMSDGCPSLIYFNLILFIVDVKLGFFLIHPLMPNTS